MSTLKEVIKTAKSLLKDGKNAEVVELLKPHVDGGVDDYELLSFAGLANFNAGNFDSSYEIFKKAINVDSSKPIAWKGIYKLFENKSRVKADQFALRVCDKMKEIAETDEKRQEIVKTYKRIAIDLKCWDIIEKDFENYKEEQELKAILAGISNQSQSECNFAKKCYEELRKMNALLSNEELFSDYCQLLKKIRDPSLNENIVKLAELYPQRAQEEWVSKELLVLACEAFFAKNEFPSFIKNVKTDPKISSIIENLRRYDTTSALEVLDSIPIASKLSFPESLLFVGLLSDAENWNECEQLVKSIHKKSTNPEVLSICDGWLARIVLETDQDSRILTKPLPLPEFLREETRRLIKLSGENEVEELLKKYPEDTKEVIIVRLISAVETNSVIAEHVKMADSLLCKGNIDWKDVLLVAEVKYSAKLDATTLLVKAAKLNPRSSRVFFVLGKSLATKNPAKAKSCLERAVKIQPENAEYCRELDSILTSQNASASERLGHLKKLLSSRSMRRKEVWLSEALAVLYLETNNLDRAIEELQTMVRFCNDNKLAWARLAQAYFKKGHLRAAVSSYEHLSKLEGGHEYTIPMIRVLVQLRDFEVSLEKVEEYRELTKDLKTLESSKLAIDTLEAQIRLNLLKTTNGDVRKEHLKESLRLLARCVLLKSNFSIVYKLAGDALLYVIKYADRFFDFFEIDKSWNVSNRLECVQLATSFYSVVLRMRKDDPLAWHDLSVALLTTYKIDKKTELLDKAQKCIKHGIELTKDEPILSTFWTLLAETLRLSDSPPVHQLHCLTRALQLNKTNDVAWLELAILCIMQSEMNLASRAVEQAIKYNSQNSDAWCAWAHHAHLQDAPYDALVMFRQALVIQPTASAVVGYCGYLCDDLKKKPCRFDCATVALDFEPVIELRDMACCDHETLYQLGLLADFFGYYKEALECFNLANISGDVVERVKMKIGIISPEENVKLGSLSTSNMRLATLLPFSKADLLAFLTNEISIYGQLFDCIARNEVVSFRSLYTANIKNISVPLFVAAVIALDITLPIGCVTTIHEALPRHELIDYFPTILPDGLDNGLRHLENDGEKPFRYRHRIAFEVLEELKNLKEKYEELNNLEGEKSEIVVGGQEEEVQVHE